ncbi:unnamed protein product [Lepeophtheirus salmonis]|uniref:(salmon louse) hypothetical protein n=1 Tax=Lepeophtheirus salmonis TaxID=72036 RepID=A0A7R8H1F0_LEPSM|nr:unnamed protein product [Lepeophtheirus salmonis]CAF2793126.1 unnamed protein product [Lepeophtheirus salmonis]
MSKCLKDTMTEFNISLEKIHLVVRDIAANMVAGDAQTCVKDLLSTCKQIVGYFNHSPSAFVKYKEHQKNHYYLLERIQEQKTAIIAYCSDNVNPSCLGNNAECKNILSARNATASIIIPNV